MQPSRPAFLDVVPKAMKPRGQPINLVTIFDYWRVIRQYRWLIVAICLVSVIVTGVWSKLFIPPAYEAKAVILPAREESSGGGISFGGDKEKGGGGGGGGSLMSAMSGKAGPSPIEALLVILHSRTIAEAVAEDLNLMEYYGTDSIVKAAQSLQRQMAFRTTPYKAIEIMALAGNPEHAARLANAYASHVDRLNKKFSRVATKRSREFIEQRLAEKSKHLSEAEEAMKAFQTKHRSLALKDQAESAFETIASLHGQIVALEVELAASRAYATPAHPVINQSEAQIAQLRRELDRLEADQVQGGLSRGRRKPLSQKAFPSIEEAPDLVLQYMRLTRQTKVEEAVYGMLVGMLEQTRISEARDLPTVELLDPAIPPVAKSKPKTLWNVVVAAGLSFALGTLLAYFLNYLALVRFQESMSLPTASLDHARGLGESEPTGNGDKVQGYPAAPNEPERVH